MGARILMVCTANVCRSPLAELLLRTELSRLGVGGVAVSSAAARHVEAGSICPDVSGFRTSSEWQEKAAAHRPRALTASDAHRADLILVASRSNRSVVARLAPQVRAKVFTMTEVAWLGEGFSPRVGRDGPDVAALTAYLDGQRGLRSAPQHRFPRLRRVSDDPLTVPDGHNLGPSIHRRTLRQVAEATGVIIGLLRS